MDINTIEDSYVLGWLLSSSTIIEDNIVKLNIKSWDKKIIFKLYDILSKIYNNIEIKHGHLWENTNYIEIISSELIEFLQNFNDFELIRNKQLFIRGLFEGSGDIYYNKEDNLYCYIESSKEICKFIKDTINIPSTLNDFDLIYNDTNCIDFLGVIYKSYEELILPSMYDKFTKIFTSNAKLPLCEVYKTDENAVIPSKHKLSDVGYDLTIIKEKTKWLNNITLYDTGIKVNVQNGYYCEVVPRSSLSKSGYMLANSIGIIDRSYRGNIYIALVKVDPTAEDIKLPFKCCQLIFRKQIHMNISEVQTDFEKTYRDQGGFGSSGN